METNLILLSVFGSAVFIVLAMAFILQRMENNRLRDKLNESKIDAVEKKLNEESMRSQLANLTLTERKITDKLADGLSEKEIADVFKIATSTVKAHKKSIYKKMNVHKNTDLIIVMRDKK